MKSITVKFALGLVAVAAALPSNSSANILVNGSFETAGNWVNTGGGYDRLLVGATSMTGWTVVNSEIVWGGPANADGIVAPDGSYFLDLTSYGASGLGGITQTIPTVMNASYHFSMDLFNPFGDAIQVEVDTGAGTHFLTTTGGFDFLATGASTPIKIIEVSGGYFVGVDDVSVTANRHVPDASSTFGLLSGGTMALFAMRRKINS